MLRSEPQQTERSPIRDPWVWVAIAFGAILRWVPVAFWTPIHCVRDECLYGALADRIGRGDGLVRTEGWLWAPGYPYIVAAMDAIRDPADVMAVQVVVSTLCIGLVALICYRVSGARAAQIGAWMMALHPTLAFFAGRIWPETFFIAGILLAVYGILWAREGPWWRAGVPGVVMGFVILLRGMATPMAAVMIVAMMWSGQSAAWSTYRKHALAMAFGVFCVVSPWSWHASTTHGGLIISDATVGQMAWQGNNVFAPQSFDYGLLQEQSVIDAGRAHCPRSLPAAQWNACELRGAAEFVAAEPLLFAKRVPYRLSQLLNPNTFLTRHMRRLRWPQLPDYMRTPISVWAMIWSLLIMFGGAAGLWTRAKGPVGVVVVGTVAYYLLVISCLAGMSRFRLPLEPLLIVWVADLLANPGAARLTLERSPIRLVGLLVTLPILLALVARFAVAGFVEGAL